MEGMIYIDFKPPAVIRKQLKTIPDLRRLSVGTPFWVSYHDDHDNYMYVHSIEQYRGKVFGAIWPVHQLKASAGRVREAVEVVAAAGCRAPRGTADRGDEPRPSGAPRSGAWSPARARCSGPKTSPSRRGQIAALIVPPGEIERWRKAPEPGPSGSGSTRAQRQREALRDHALRRGPSAFITAEAASPGRGRIPDRPERVGEAEAIREVPVADDRDRRVAVGRDGEVRDVATPAAGVVEVAVDLDVDRRPRSTRPRPRPPRRRRSRPAPGRPVRYWSPQRASSDGVVMIPVWP